jgi:hypothetical protein
LAEIASLAEKLIRQDPSNPKEISKLNDILSELSNTLGQEILNSPIEDFLVGKGKFSLDEIMFVTETSTKLGKKQGELAKKNPQMLKWPTFQLLLHEYSETTDIGTKKRLSKEAKSEIKKLISARKNSLRSSPSPQEQTLIKQELDELNQFLQLVESLFT